MTQLQLPIFHQGAHPITSEHGVLIGSRPSEQIWVRDRKLTSNGRQIAIVSTEWDATLAEIVDPQFGRWYQENFIHPETKMKMFFNLI